LARITTRCTHQSFAACEKTGADSEDHVIAESFFAGTTNEIPRLLAHKGCNNRCAPAEEYVRNVLAQLDPATGDACEVARGQCRASSAQVATSATARASTSGSTEAGSPSLSNSSTSPLGCVLPGQIFWEPVLRNSTSMLLSASFV
jgi:hypothetical protein